MANQINIYFTQTVNEFSRIRFIYDRVQKHYPGVIWDTYFFHPGSRIIQKKGGK
jgi:hypothetical protein